MLAASRWGSPAPAFPEGDLIVPAERLYARLKVLATRLHAPDMNLAACEQLVGRAGEGLLLVERSFARWRFAGLVLLATALTTFALLHDVT